MYKYSNEAAFSKAVCRHLRSKGYFVQRIESGSTGRGIPDIFTITPTGIPMWVELKRVHGKCRRCAIPWREGQQAWLLEVSVRYKMQCVTLVAFDDCICCISHNQYHHDNIVDCQKYQCIRAIQDL